MDINDFYKFALTVLASIGGAGAIFYGLSSYLGKMWAEKVLNKNRFELKQELEKIKSDYQLSIDLNKEEYISELRKKEEEYKSELRKNEESYKESINQERESVKFDFWKKEQEILLDIDIKKEEKKASRLFNQQLGTMMKHFHHIVKHVVDGDRSGYCKDLEDTHKKIRIISRDNAFLFKDDSDDVITKVNIYTDLALSANKRGFDFFKYDEAKVNVGRFLSKLCE